MTQVETIRVVQTDLYEHPAVLAWNEFNPLPVKLERIEVLKGKLPQQTDRIKRLVCRFVQVDPVGVSVVGKRCKLAQAMIENTIYKEVLPNLPIPTLDYYGMIEEANSGYCWLFLEDAGEQEYSDLIDEHRALRTQWLSRMHTLTANLSLKSCLPDKGPDHYLKRLQFSRCVISDNLASLELRADERVPLETIVFLCNKLESHWDQVKTLCEGFPKTLVHGDFVAKNLRFRCSQAGLILFPFDWGESGWGIPAVDMKFVGETNYWSAVRQDWIWLDADSIRRLAIAGKIFRSLDAVYWILGDFKHGMLKKPLSCLRIYATWLFEVIQSAGLN